MSNRADRLTEQFPAAEIDALLVTNLVNVRYLTGYTGSNGAALIGAELRAFLTDFRYAEQAAVEVDPSYDRLQVVQDLLDGVAQVLPEGQLRLGFDDRAMSVAQHAHLREELPDSVELVRSGGLVERLRMVKEPAEIAAIAAATELADASVEWLLSTGLIGRTERELAIALEHDMRERGAQGPSFDSIVAGGAHGALPHAQPRGEPIARGELVVIDWGAELDGYCSDCTRTIAAGPAESDAEEVYGFVLEAQLAALGAIRAGANGKQIDAVARDLIAGHGHGDHFGHGLGHGVGMEIHEGPRLSLRSTDEDIPAASVVTVEPGIYIPGRFGVRIEDLVVVTDDGCRILTGIPKALRVVD
jgi:Xaa-Pro aminopeptidase